MLPARLKADHYKPKERLRSTAHRDWIRGHNCCVPGCQQMPIEVAHVSRSYSGGIGIKSSDAMCVSLCRDHHSESHRGERTFAHRHGIDLMAMAKAFFAASPHRHKLDDPWRFQ